MAKKKDAGSKVIADNRKARFAYAIEGEERRAKRVSKSSGLAKATNAASLSERPEGG